MSRPVFIVKCIWCGSSLCVDSAMEVFTRDSAMEFTIHVTTKHVCKIDSARQGSHG